MDAFIATTSVTNAGLSARAERLYAFMQARCDYTSRCFIWRKAKTCAALGISASTYARAASELLKKGLIRAQQRYTENGRQLTTCYYVVSTGHRFGVEAEALETLSHSAFRVYMEISRSCGQASWAISRRSLAVKLKLSMRTISRAVRELRDKDMIQVTPENRLHICGNRGQTFNRFRVHRLPERHLRRARRKLLFLALLLATPLDNFDTPTFHIPTGNSKEKKTKLSPIAKLKEIAGKIKNKIWQWKRALKAALPD